MNTFIGIGKINDTSVNGKVLKFNLAIQQERPCSVPCVLFGPNDDAKGLLELFESNCIKTSQSFAKRENNIVTKLHSKMILTVPCNIVRINHRPDIVVINRHKRIAVEIETGKSDVVHNVKKALKAGFDEVICVGTSRYAEDKIRQELDNSNIADSRLKVTSVLAFDLG